MAAGPRRRLSYKQAEEFLERRHGRPVGDESVGRMLHILWWMIVGKRRFVPDDASAETIRAEKKRTRRHRRRTRRRHR